MASIGSSSPVSGSWRSLSRSPALGMGSPMLNRAAFGTATPQRSRHAQAREREPDSPPETEEMHYTAPKQEPSEPLGGHVQESPVHQPHARLIAKKVAKSDRCMEGYLWGQIGNVAKMGVWWTVFGPLVLAVFKGSAFGVGGMRVAFNLAMLLVSPLAGVFAERVSIRAILVRTTVARLVIYVFVMPGLWVVLQSGYVLHESTTLDVIFYVAFFFLVFVDGIAVAFANVVDIDCGGTDLVAAQYGAVVTDETRNRFNSLHEAYFDGSMIVLSPLVAGCSLIFTTYVKNDDTAMIVGTMAALFLFTSLFSLYHYVFNIEAHVRPPRYQPMFRKNSDEDDDETTKSSGCCCSCSELCAEFRRIFLSMADGLKVCWKHKAIRWRLIFLALETAFEDAMISLLLIEFAMNGVEGGENYALGNLISNAMVACGKTGGVISAIMMHRYWKAPENTHAGNSQAFRPLFAYVFFGGLFTLLLPLANWLRDEYDYRAISLVLVFFGTFMFFIFSTPPKIGFATLLQGLAAETDATGRIFGFVAAFLTIMDSLILLGLSAVFSGLNLQHSLEICCGLIALHGFVELVAGPSLVLTALPSDDPNQPLLDPTGTSTGQNGEGPNAVL